MINVLIPMAGKAVFYKDENYIYPKPLTEVKGQPMIQGVIENFNTINDEVNYIFAVNKEDCKKFHIDSVLELLTNKAEIIRVDNETAGAACTALLAIDTINNDTPLIISNADQFFDCELNRYIDEFNKRDLDAGVVCFESVHPRWSYALTNDDGYIIETSEKRPISKQAIAGLFYFKKGQYFVSAAMKSIAKDAHVNGSYYIAPVFNELVLDGKKMGVSMVENNKYHTFYSTQLLEEYNRTLS